MRLREFYAGMTPDLQTGVLAACRKRGIRYPTLWRQHVRPLHRGTMHSSIKDFRHAVIDHVFIFDFLYIWMNCYALAMLARLAPQEGADQAKTTNQQRSKLLLSARVCSDLRAIRCLILAGAAIQAKHIARSMSECIDALSLAFVDTTFCDDFVAQQDIDENKKMWFRHIAKGRARAKVERHCAQILGDDVVRSDREYRNQEETVLSAAAHPSFVTGWLTIFPHDGYHTAEDVVGITNHISPHSLRTLTYSAYRICCFAMNDLVVFRGGDSASDERPNTTSDIMKRLAPMVQQGREIALLIVEHLADDKQLYELTAFSSSHIISEQAKVQ